MNVELSYEVVGEGPLVLCAHGFPDHARSFRHQVSALTAQGFSVVCPTMRGYAPSGVSPSGRYDAEALGTDLCMLAKKLSPSAPVRLLGHDWGAIAAYAATAMAPELFSHMVTMAVPHPRNTLPRMLMPSQVRRSWYLWMFQLRGYAEKRLAENNLALIDQLWRDWSPSYRASPEELAQIKEGIASRIGPVLAYYRALSGPAALFGNSRSLLLSKTSVPSLYLHGAEDGCIGVELMHGAEAHYRASIELLKIPGAGHFLHLERPEPVNDAILAFFGRP